MICIKYLYLLFVGCCPHSVSKVCIVLSQICLLTHPLMRDNRGHSGLTDSTWMALSSTHCVQSCEVALVVTTVLEVPLLVVSNLIDTR